MPLNHGAMQDYPLTLDRMIDHAAKWHPDKEVAYISAKGGVERADYTAIRAGARSISALLADRGVGVGDCVATLAWNSRAHLEAWYGIMGMGAVCHTLNPRLTPATLADMVRQSQAAILFVSADLQELALSLCDDCPAISEVIVIDGPSAETSRDDLAIGELSALLRDERPPVQWGQFDERSPCGLCFTSGTTGAPKGVTYTHRANYLHALRQLGADVTGIGKGDTVLVAVPMFHANAWGLPFVAPAAGARMVLPGRDTGARALADLIESEGVTIAVAVPTVWLALYDYLDESGRTLPSLKRIMVGGAPMPTSLAERITASGVEVQTSWGMTELSPLGTASVPGSSDAAAGSSGVPSLGIDLMVAGHDGEPLPEQREHEGRLLVRGQAVVERYFGEDIPATEEGWFDTGDLAVIGQDGAVTITGRSKDLIKSGGEWINPVVIEQLVAKSPAVSLAAVIARHDDKWGERPVLFVEIRQGQEVADDALQALIRGAVPDWWLPDDIVRLKTMPLAATGKVDKARLGIAYVTGSLSDLDQVEGENVA